MIVHHELKLVLGTPFGCAARLENAASWGSELEIVEGRSRYSMSVPALYQDYTPTLVVRNPYERAVLLWRWAQKGMPSKGNAEALSIPEGKGTFPKYMNHVNRITQATRAFIRRAEYTASDLAEGHFYWHTRTFRQCWLELGSLDPAPNLLVLEDEPDWLQDLAGVWPVTEDWSQHYFRDTFKGELRLREGTCGVVNRLWASEDCCFVGSYDHFGEWEKHSGPCNGKHKSGAK